MAVYPASDSITGFDGWGTVRNIRAENRDVLNRKEGKV